MTPTPSWTVNDVMRSYPISVATFKKLGIDTCCGATATLETAAQKAGLTPDELLTALQRCTIDDGDTPPARDHRATTCACTGAC